MLRMVAPRPADQHSGGLYGWELCNEILGGVPGSATAGVGQRRWILS